MSAQLAEEHRELQELVARFVERELRRPEPRIIERGHRGEHPGLNLVRVIALIDELDLVAYDARLRRPCRT